MATLLKIPDYLPLRSIANSLVQVRYKKKVYRNIKVKSFQDPRNLSWTQQIFDEQKEPVEEKEPAMLHMVKCIHTAKHRPYWEKNILKELNLFGDGKFGNTSRVQVVKNIPQVNAQLKRINHLIEITPVTFPHGLPKSEADYEHCLLQDNGEFIVKHTVLPEDLEKEVKVVQRPSSDSVYKMTPETLNKENKKKLEQYRLNQEYFQAKYTYKYNQDKKEWRYNGDHNICPDRDWY